MARALLNVSQQMVGRDIAWVIFVTCQMDIALMYVHSHMERHCQVPLSSSLR
jgi:hypothetical protein